MGNYNSLKTTIDANIKQNGNQEITGQILNSVLNQMVTTLGAGYQFAGVATTATNPGSPDAKMFYIANGKGTYTNFGSLEVTEDDVVVLYWDSSWHKVSTGIASQEKLTELDYEKKSFVYELIGKDKNAVFAKLKLKKGIPYIISTPELWDVSELTINIFFSVGYYNGNYNDVIFIGGTDAYKYKRAYTYIQNEECEYTYIQIKAPNGIVVPITISELNGNISLISNTIPNINSKTGILDLGEDPNLFIGSAVFTQYDMKNYRSIPIQTEGEASQGSSRRKLWYNVITGMFGTSDYDEVLRIEEILIGSFVTRFSVTGAYLGTLNGVNLPFDYTIDGKYKDTTEVQTLIQGESGIGFSSTLRFLPNIDTINKTLDLGADPVLYLGREYYAFESLFPNNPEYYRSIPIYEEGSATGAIKLVFNYNTKRIYAKGATTTVRDNERVIGGIRLVYDTHKFISANLPFDYTVDGKTFVQREIAKEKNKYSGERPNLPRFYEINSLLTLSQAGQYDRAVDTQGMDIYANKFLFQGNNPKASEPDNYNNIFVIDLETNTLIRGFEYKKESHVNTVNCGALYDSSDTYPLLYVSECYYGHGCDVIRLNNDLSSYQSIQRISYAGSQYFSGWTAYDWTIDLENSFIYAFGTNNGFTQILKFALPSPTSGDVEFSDDDILDVFEFTGAYIYQGAKVINNQMFIPFGFGTAEYPAYMKVFDMSRKEVISHIPLDGFGETEAVALYKGKIIIVNNSVNPTYREIIL